MLNPYYSTQYISGEVASVDDGQDVTSIFKLYKKPMTGTLAAFVMRGETLINTLFADVHNNFDIKDVDNPEIKVVKVDIKDFEVTLTWNSTPGLNHIIASYDYNLECEWDAEKGTYINPGSHLDSDISNIY